MVALRSRTSKRGTHELAHAGHKRVSHTGHSRRRTPHFPLFVRTPYSFQLSGELRTQPKKKKKTRRKTTKGRTGKHQGHHDLAAQDTNRTTPKSWFGFGVSLLNQLKTGIVSKRTDPFHLGRC